MRNPESTPEMRHLIISADDYGYAPGYDAGILEAAEAGAIDAASAMVRRGRPETMPLLLSGVEVGLHLELEAGADRSSVLFQLEAFEVAFGRPPAFLDGHHHSHAAPGIALTVGQVAAERNLVVRSVDEAHRRLLRRLGVATPDLLLGRTKETEPAVPPELEGVMTGEGGPPAEIVEWMVHPGRTDPSSGSGFDSGREQDLRLLLDLLDAGSLRGLRATHARALA